MFDLIAARTAVYSPHTAFDSAAAGSISGWPKGWAWRRSGRWCRMSKGRAPGASADWKSPCLWTSWPRG